MEKLELKHLAPYLPYGLKGRVDKETYLQEENERIGELKTIDLADNNYELAIYGDLGYFLCDIHDFKPILHPLSDLTKEIEYGGERFVPIIELYNLKTQIGSGIYHDYYIENNTAILRFKGINFDEFQFIKYFEIDLEPNQVMFSIVTETWKDDELQQEIINLCGNEMLMFEKLKEWHFDISGLIEKDLAVDINTLSE